MSHLPQGWQCPSCRAIHNPETIMCWCYGNKSIAQPIREPSPWAPSKYNPAGVGWEGGKNNDKVRFPC